MTMNGLRPAHITGARRNISVEIQRAVEWLTALLEAKYGDEWCARIDHRARFILIRQRLDSAPKRE